MENEKKEIVAATSADGHHANSKGHRNDRQKWINSVESLLEYILKNDESEHASFALEELVERLRDSGIKIPHTVNTPYVNTIPVSQQPKRRGLCGGRRCLDYLFCRYRDRV